MPTLVETTATSTAPITLAEAQAQLSYIGSDQDTYIESLITAATDWAERFTQRTLRASVTRRLSQCDWWSDPLVLPWPPVSSVTSVYYYDASNADTLLASSNYHVQNDTDGTSRIRWASTATLPTLYDRPDAVRVLYVTGYQSVASVPATIKQALKAKVQALFGQDEPRAIEQFEKCACDLLGTVEWPRYS